MAKTKAINADEQLKNVEGVTIFNVEDMPEPPMTCEVPEGWSPLRAMEGECWYDRVLAWEERTGRKMIPLKYMYDENGNIILRKETEDGISDSNG